MDKKVAAPTAPPIPAVATNKTFPCSSCGAKLQFQPGLRALKCPYCGAETEIPQADAPAQEGALEHQDYDSLVAVAPEEPPNLVRRRDLIRRVLHGRADLVGAAEPHMLPNPV